MAYLRMKKAKIASHQPYAEKPQKKKRQRPNRKAMKLARWGQSAMQRMISPISHGFGTNVKAQRHLRVKV